MLGAETELLIEAGQIATKRGDLPTAEKYFRQAVEVSKGSRFASRRGRGLPAPFAVLSSHEPAGESLRRRSIRASKPCSAWKKVMTFRSSLRRRRRCRPRSAIVRDADASFQRATDLVEGLLVNAPTSQVKSGMIGALSQIYLGHFRLAWNRMHDAPYAFSIIENARGRALLDSIRYARQSGPAACRANARRSRDCSAPEIADARPSNQCSDAARSGSTRSGLHPVQSRRIRPAAEGNGSGPKAAGDGGDPAGPTASARGSSSSTCSTTRPPTRSRSATRV